MNQYKLLKKRQRDEFNAFPIHAAFGEDQIRQAVAELGLSMDPESPMYYPLHIVGLGAGAFILKKDKEAYLSMVKRQREEMDQAIAADKTGNGFIYDMFLEELYNHEYGYTMRVQDTLDALGLSEKDLEANPRMLKALDKACKAVIRDS